MVDVAAILAVAEPLALDILSFVRRRQAEAGQLPTDAEVVAHAKSKVQAILAEGGAALKEFPDNDDGA
jgi:hypothetical protein